MHSYSFPFFKLSPGGNPTILTDDASIAALPQKERADIASALLHSDHLHADQIGFLSVMRSTPHMEMMGGEFCVNAVRSAAVVFALKGMLSRTGGSNEWRGEITTSGAPGPVRVLVREAVPEIAYESALALPLPEKNAVTRVDNGEILVRLPGITHLLLDTAHHPLPENPLGAAREKLVAFNLVNEDAAGVIWFSEQYGSCSIVPVVHVAATESLVLESACGSGSLAIALHLMPGKELPVMQPSGHALVIEVGPDAVWIRGTVTITAHGLTHVSV